MGIRDFGHGYLCNFLKSLLDAGYKSNQQNDALHTFFAQSLAQLYEW
jgi:hypothetical protein